MTVISAKGFSSALVTATAKTVMTIVGDAITEVETTAYARIVHPVEISSVVAYSVTRIRVTFDRPMKKNSDLTDVLNYTITPSSSWSAPVYFSEIVPEAIASPRYVDVVLDTEMTLNRSYGIEIETVDGPIGLYDDPLDASTNVGHFYGFGVIPDILSVEAIGQNRVDVVFNEAMTDNLEIRNDANYTFDKGLSVLAVLGVSSDTVQLATSDQTPGELYTLTVVPT